VVGGQLVPVVQVRHGREVAAGGGDELAASFDRRQVGGEGGQREERRAEDQRQEQHREGFHQWGLLSGFAEAQIQRPMPSVMSNASSMAARSSVLSVPIRERRRVLSSDRIWSPRARAGRPLTRTRASPG